MNKTYISSLLVVLLAGAQTIRAQGSLDDAMTDAPAKVETAQPASMDDAGENAIETTGHISTEKLFERAVELYDAGSYREARVVFEAVLSEDPYNRRAMNYLTSTAAKVRQLEKRKTEASRAAAFADVKAEWNPDLNNAVGAAIGAAQTTEKSPKDIAIEQMVARLKSITVPTLDFPDANIKDVVLYLTEVCRRKDVDPSGNGVNIILLGLSSSDQIDAGALGNNISLNIQKMSLYDALQYIVEMAGLKFEVGPNVVSIMPVNYIRPVDMIMESFIVIPEVGEQLSGMADGEGSGGGIEDLFGGSSGAPAADTGPVDVSKYFSPVAWPEGSSATYYPDFRKLVVKNSPANIESVEQLLSDQEFEAIKRRSQQVLIEAKFIEFNEGAMKELGFNWNVYGSGTVGGFGLIDQSTYKSVNGYLGANSVNWVRDSGQPDLAVLDASMQLANGQKAYTTQLNGTQVVDGPGDKKGESIFGAGRRSNKDAFIPITSGLLASMGGVPADMLFTNGDVDLKISALEQNGTADVLSSPKVTTQSGYEAVIRVTEIHRYPQDWDVETGQRTAPVVKPQDWEDFDLGVVLRVTPEVDPVSNTIKLEINPEIRKFLGFDLYPVAFNAYDRGTINEVDETGDGKTLFAQMPYFETRSVQTRVTVADGNTVMMGGLVDEATETFRDQVPILGDLPYIGRLFRTEGSRNVKKNLVIYIKATQVDERGMTRIDREIAGKAVEQ